MPQGIDGAWDGLPRQEWVRHGDWLIFDTQPDGTVIVSVQVMEQMLTALGFRKVDTVQGDVLESVTHTDVGGLSD